MMLRIRLPGRRKIGRFMNIVKENMQMVDVTEEDGIG